MRPILQNIFGYALFAELHGLRIHGHYHETSDCSEYPKISLLQSSLPKKYLPNFPTKKIWELKVSSPKRKPHSCHLEIRISPRPAGCANRILF